MLNNKKIFIVFFSLLLMTLLIGVSTYAAPTETVVQDEPEGLIKKSIQNSVNDSFLSGDKSNDGIDLDKIKETRENFSVGKGKAKAQEKSLTMLVVWVTGSGLLYFVNKKWATGLLVSGILGYGLINYAEELVGLIQGGIDWIFG